MSVMRASVGLVAVTVVAALAGGGSAGCVKQRPTMSKPPPAQNQGNGGRRVQFQPQELDRKSGQFAELARRLPASSAQQDRAMMRQAFTLLVDILPLTVGPNRGGVFEHQLSVVNDTRSQLQDRSADLSIDPIVNNGLAAVFNALDDAARSTYPSESEIAQGVRDYKQKLEEIYSLRGMARWPVIAEALRGVSDILSKMSQALATRAPGGPSLPPPPPDEPGPTTRPTTGPTTGPGDAMPPDAPPDAPPPVAPPDTPPAPPPDAPPPAAPGVPTVPPEA
jgi:hypothetical protein